MDDEEDLMQRLYEMHDEVYHLKTQFEAAVAVVNAARVDANGDMNEDALDEAIANFDRVTNYRFV